MKHFFGASLLALFVAWVGCSQHLPPTTYMVHTPYHWHRGYVIPVIHNDHIAFWADHKWDKGWIIDCAISATDYTHHDPSLPFRCPVCGELLSHDLLYFDSREI